jgi:lipid II isoglutaminyl synthase (glutamine-hydrolysing)
MKSLTITVGWLYPELMSTYGDRGNIIVYQKRCEWRGINIEILKLNPAFDVNLLNSCDFLFMGGAQDEQQQIVAQDLVEKRNLLKQKIEEGVPGLYICGAYQFLGKYYKEADGTIIKGLGILDLHTENPGLSSSRLIGNILMSTANGMTMVGFENHGGRTYLGKNVKPFGKVIKGFGNNGKDAAEGVIYKNSYGTYLHGPILPKNPELTDLLIKLTLENKYKLTVNFHTLEDSLEKKAYNAIAKRLKVKL